MTVRRYEKAPSSLPLLLKAAAPTLPGVGALPGIKHTGKGVPDLELQRAGITIDLDRLQRYNDICGFARAETIPSTYVHNSVHALLMSLMTDPSFPFAPMGAVHLRNSISQLRPIGREEVFDLSLKATAILPHPKGKLVEIASAVTIADETVWTETMTTLFRGKGGAPEETTPVLEGVEVPDGAVHWKLDGKLGPRFARISGDYNPIHLSPLLAKPLGFPRNIAHGMWSKARCLGALQNRLPDAYTVDIEFKKPVILPTTVIFGADVADSGHITFGMKGASKPVPHLVGQVTPL